jgi:hypothetical protein
MSLKRSNGASFGGSDLGESFEERRGILFFLNGAVHLSLGCECGLDRIRNGLREPPAFRA